MAANNAILYNAALAGSLAGMLTQRGGATTSSADYAGAAGAAAAFATELDALIATQTTTTQAMAILVANISRSMFEGTYTVDGVAADYAKQAQVAFAVWQKGNNALV
jgi:hypothetical protein